MKFEEYNENYGRNEFGNQFEKEATQMSALQSLLIGNELTAEEVPLLREFACVQEFLDLPLNDPREGDLKKMFTAAIVMAEEKGVLPFELPDKSPVAIASLVDEGLTRLKVAYQTAKGMLDPIEAADALIDRIAVRSIAVADRVIEKGVPLAMNVLCTTLVKVWPPAAAVVPVIKSTERCVTVATKVVARKGIRMMADAAKTAVRKVANTARKIAGKVFNFLKA